MSCIILLAETIQYIELISKITMITIKELAKILNLAPSSVSMALNNRKGISPAVRKRVKEVAKRYGYMPYIKSRETGMYDKQSRVITIIFPKCDTHITETIQSGIDDIVNKQDYHKIRYTIDLYNELNTEKDKDNFIQEIMENTSTKGLILFSIPLSETTITKLTKKGIYVVLLNIKNNYSKCVYMDNVTASYKAVTKFIESGRKNIGLVIPDETMGTEWKDRFEGYKKALQEYKIGLNPDLILYENTFDNLIKISYATKILVDKNPDIDSIFYASDIFAFGGIKMLKNLGKKIPDDIAIIGIDNMPIDTVFQPELSSVELPLFQMGQMGAKILIDSIKKEKYNPVSILIDDSKLILRESFSKIYKNEKITKNI